MIIVPTISRSNSYMWQEGPGVGVGVGVGVSVAGSGVGVGVGVDVGGTKPDDLKRYIKSVPAVL
jgi:hypothetical protein